MSARKPVKTSNQDADDYWNTSTLKRFNFDDDDEEDSIDIIQWDGSTAAPVKPQSQQTTRPKPATSGFTQPRAQSARAFHTKAKSQPTTPQSVKFTVNNGASKVTSMADTNSVTENIRNKDSFSTTDYVKLETERNALRRQLHQAKKERATAPSRGETLKHMMLGEPAVLELYRSIEEKTSLLDDAIRRHDGNAILAVTLFMRNSLKRELFSKELMNRPVAVDHYCSYLRAISENEELHEILTVLGRTEEAAMLKYRHCLNNSRSPEVRINGLKDCIKYYFDSDPRLANETREIQSQVSLLERQIIIDDNDAKTQASNQPSVFKTHPRRESIAHKSLITTLYYCCYYHWGETEGILSSPQSIRTEYKISDKQFHYMAVSALCRMRKWRDLEQLLTTQKSLFRNARLYSCIGFDKVVDLLTKNLAPPDAIAKYCAEIENSELRLETAVKNKCYKVAIDTLVLSKDRQHLMSYLNSIPDSQQHMRQHLVNEAKRTDIKWKN